MASQFQRQFTIPPEFPRVLKDLTREVLRAQPDNIYAFAAEYFVSKLQERDAVQGFRSSISGQGGDLDMNQLQDAIMECFLQADTDGSGTLDRREFKELIRSLNLNLTSRELRAILAEADENDDGVLEYREFVPVMVQLVYALRARNAAASAQEIEEAQAREAAETYLLRGVPRETLEGMLRGIFASADSNGNGTLSRKEFTSCLKNAKLGLTRKDINLLLSEVEMDENGEISYQSFLPLCFNMLVERFKFDMLQNRALQSNDDLSLMMLQEFQAEGAGEDGLLSLKAVKAAITRLSEDVLGLSSLQVLSVVSAAVENDKGQVDVLRFAPVASEIIWGLIDAGRQEARVNAINELGVRLADQGADRLTRFDPEEFRSVLVSAMQAADADGSGLLERDVVERVLHSLGTGTLGLTRAELNSLRAAVEADENGMVEYGAMADFLYEVMEHMAREQYIVGAASGTGYDDWYQRQSPTPYGDE